MIPIMIILSTGHKHIGHKHIGFILIQNAQNITETKHIGFYSFIKYTEYALKPYLHWISDPREMSRLPLEYENVIDINV